MPTKSQILDTDPHKVLGLIDGWMADGRGVGAAGGNHLGYVERPGGAYWEGRTAEAAQARARQDVLAVIRVGDTIWCCLPPDRQQRERESDAAAGECQADHR